MRLTNHIAFRYLTDDTLVFEMIEKQLGYDGEGIAGIDVFKGRANYRAAIESAGNENIRNMWHFLNRDNQKAFIITDTVADKLDYLKVKRNSENLLDWTVFNGIPEGKRTFIYSAIPQFKGGGCLRIEVKGEQIAFCQLRYKFNDGSKEKGTAMWEIWYINRYNNEHGSHALSSVVQETYEHIYKLLCFVFLGENEYEEIAAGGSKGTRKQGKIKNDLPVPLTIINSKWNITTIRTEGFPVSAHFAFRRCGTGRGSTRLVFIQAFDKKGYKRGAKAVEVNK